MRFDEALRISKIISKYLLVSTCRYFHKGSQEYLDKACHQHKSNSTHSHEPG